MTTKELVQSYYESLNNKDHAWERLWADESIFQDASKILNAQGKDAVIQSFTPFLKGVESVSVSQMIIGGQHVCACVTYIYINAKGEKLQQDVAEIWEVKNEKLISLVIYFDLTAYRTFMRG